MIDFETLVERQNILHLPYYLILIEGLYRRRFFYDCLIKPVQPDIISFLEIPKINLINQLQKAGFFITTTSGWQCIISYPKIKS